MTYKCQNCGAPLEGIVCPYCHTRNGVDLKKSFDIYQNPERICPNCEILLYTHLIDANKQLYIETCKHCDGIFLDFGEIEEIMESRIKKSERYDFKRLDAIKNNPLVREKTVRYKKCPECRKMMLRINYRNKSGVILDRCKHHGYWLDSGELRQVMEWAKLEGLTDFRPMIEKESTLAIPVAVYDTRNIDTTPKIDLIESFFRKLYGL